MNLVRWTHPETGETRVYINRIGPGVSRAYIIDGGAFGNYPPGFPELVVVPQKGSLIGQSEVDRIADLADKWVESHRVAPTPWAAPTFADYWAAAG